MLYDIKLAEELRGEIALLSESVNKVEDDKDWTFDVIATTQDRDRDNESILVRGWDTKNRDKNPVILANHDYTIESIIWKGLKFYTSKGVKRLKGVFSKTNPLGVLARNLYNEGMLKSVSVGFIPLERDQNDFKIITKAELLETSFVAVPCNPNAISLDKKQYDEAVSKWLIIEEKCEDCWNKEEEEPTTKELMQEIQALKEIVMKLADDKVASDEVEQEQKELLEKKKFLQDLNTWISGILRDLKQL